MYESNENRPDLDRIVDITKRKTEGKKETMLTVPTVESERFSSGEIMADPTQKDAASTEEKKKKKLTVQLPIITSYNDNKATKKNVRKEDKEKENLIDQPPIITYNDNKATKVNVRKDSSRTKEGILDKIKKHWKIILLTFCIFTVIISLIFVAPIAHIFNLIDGNWNEWGNWSQCSATCGHGLTNRIRTCSGKYCPGQNVEYQMCNLKTCTGDIAAFSWKFKIENGILTFPDRPHDNGKIYEHGNGFNPDTGVFTSSIPGIYLFSVTLVKEESNSNLTCHLYKTEPYPSSNQLISLILNSSNYSSNSYSYASATVTVDLKRNDTVYISNCSASSSSSKAYSVFSGVLLHQTI